MRRLSSALLAALVVACAPPGALSSPTPALSATATVETPSPSPSPARVPGSVVRMSVNGVDVPPGGEMQATTDPPATVLITFPFAVDRGSVERWLPGSAPHDWLDDRTLRVTVRDATDFKVPETLSADGATVIEFFVVSVAFPASHTVELYRVADLISAAPSPRPVESSRLRLPPTFASVRRLNGESVSSDASLVLLYAPTGSAPQMIDVKGGTSNAVVIPAGADAGFVFAGWLSDGRLLFVGTRVWLGDARGERMTPVADAGTLDWSRPAAVAPFASRFVAFAYADGAIAVLDLATGITRYLTQRFHPCNKAPSLTWSLDGALLIGTDCESGDEATEKLRVVDIAVDRTVRTIDASGVFRVSTFANGHILVERPSPVQGEGAPSIGVEMKLDGSEVRRYTGAGGWTMSPDGIYVLQSDQLGGAASSLASPWRLIDTRSGKETQFQIPPGVTQWLSDGRLVDVNTYK